MRRRPSLRSLPVNRYRAVLTIDWRISKVGMISVGGNRYSVPDTMRPRILEIQHHVTELQIFEDVALIARPPVIEGKH